jgi:cation diffusion facilitator family transporter
MILNNILRLDDKNLIKSASYASVVVSIIITFVKSYAWLSTDSQSLFASLVDSLLDITSSLINLIAIRVVLTPPDDNHRFGHNKFQDLAIFSQSVFFFASCLTILYSAFKALYMQAIPNNAESGVNSMYLCTFLTFVLVIYQAYVVKKTNSKLIDTDKLHYFSDFLMNVAVVVSLYLSHIFWYIDAIMGIAIAAYIMRASFLLFRSALKNLVDEEFKQEDRDKIIEIISSFPEAKGMHELKTRSAGDKPFIQFHLEIDGSLSLLSAHDISDKIADKVLKHFPSAEVIIHQDPV